MTAPYLAPSLVLLRSEYDTAHPTRPRDSDGWIGDTSHAARTSDHNPLPNGLVWAVDLTTNAANTTGSGNRLAEHLRATRDPRIKYVIHLGRIFSGAQGPSPWIWRPYSGPSPHTRHVHISGRGDPHDLRPWNYRPQETPAMLTTNQAAQLRQALDHAAAADLRALDATQRLERVEKKLDQILAKIGRG